MRKIIKLGKIDYLNNGRKNCPVEIEMELRETPKGLEFACSGTIWNHLHTDCYQGGQCIDTIAEYVKTKQMADILRLWQLYHLNGMHAGTPAQEKALKQYRKENNINGWNYDGDCKYLKSIGLYEDNGYKYGTGWLYEPIPNKDLELIKSLIA